MLSLGVASSSHSKSLLQIIPGLPAVSKYANKFRQWGEGQNMLSRVMGYVMVEVLRQFEVGEKQPC